jgi:hypothetical protein
LEYQFGKRDFKESCESMTDVWSLQHFKPRLRKQILNSQPDIQPMDTLQQSQNLRNHPIIFFIFPELHYISNFKIIYGLFLGLLGVFLGE